jgi:3-oxoacyl-[acyl-carrier-protein] synthase II
VNAMSGMSGMVITGLGAVAPDVNGPADALAPAVPPWPDWFDVRTALPGRGYKRLPPGCQYLLAAAKESLKDAGDCLSGVAAERRATVVGTNNVGAALQESMDRTIIDSGAAELSPTTAPFMAMSSFASRLSTEFSIRGFNLTANSPATAGLEALQIAQRALAAGRAEVLLAGAAEDAPLPSQFDGDGADTGAAVLVCEPVASAEARGATTYGACQVYSAYLDPERPESETAEVLGELWDRMAGAALAKPVRVDGVLDGSPVGTAVAGWLREHVGELEPATVNTAVNGGSLTPVRRIVGLLAAGVPELTQRVVVAASAQGNVAVAGLTLFPRELSTSIRS